VLHDYYNIVQHEEFQMVNLADKVSVKMVGTNGQISFGKKYAGRHMIVEEQAEGVWLVRTAKVIPDAEAWLHQPQAAHDLTAALDHAVRTNPDAANATFVLDSAKDGA
jgi:hypothetical protein